MEIEALLNPDDAKAAAAGRLNDVIGNYGRHPILLLLSGGSALGLLDFIDIKYMGPHVTVAPLDERYSTDPAVSNMAQIVATDFYDKAKSAGCNFIDTRVTGGETKEELAKRFGESLNRWLEENPKGEVVATIGIGNDGHTSGIMPHPDDADFFRRTFEDASLAVAYDAGSKNEYSERITTTMTLMRKIKHAIVYAVGESKRAALADVAADKGTLNNTPARVLRELPIATIFTDLHI